MKSHVALLKESVEHLKTNSRGVFNKSDNCVYINDDGDRCLIGRLLPKDVCEDLEKKYPREINVFTMQNANFKTVHSRLNKSTLDRLDKLLTDYKSSFLIDLQDLHDQERNWKTNKKRKKGVLLSEFGEIEFAHIMTSAEKLDAKGVK